jgi:hypothetical protein
VGAGVEVVMAITRMATMRHFQTLPITVHHRLPTATDAVEYLTITHTDLPRTRLGHHHSNSTAVGTVRAVPGHSRRLPPTAGTLTQMAAVPRRGRLQARIVGADITLGPQVEAAMVVATMVVPEVDMAAAAAAAAVGVMDMDMAEEGGGFNNTSYMRADIVLAAMMVAIVLGVEDRREDVAEAEVSDALASDFDVYSIFYYLFLHIRLLVLCFV